MKKIIARPKPEMKAKPGQLLRTTIEYGAGDGASVHHEHEPDAGKSGEPWSPGASNLKHNFTTRMEAHHAAAKHAGVNCSMDDAEGGKGDNAAEEAAEGE